MRPFRLLVALVLLSACGDCGDPDLVAADALVATSADALHFGPVHLGAAPGKTLTIRAAGTGSVEVLSLALEGDDVFTLAAPPAATLGRGQALAVEVTFRPREVRASVATLVVRTDVEGSEELRVAVSGEGLAARDCDDGEDCTTDSFDPVAGTCTNAVRDGRCDDGTACTTDERCVSGRCLGAALACDDDSPCTRDLCDAARGCVSFVDPSVCDDANPCTAESCDEDGCHHADVANGTPCGTITSCTAVPLCFFGRCERFDAPDGTPCSDGDVCTTADACRGGTCSGTRQTRAPEVTARLSAFGTRATEALVLSDSRLVFSHALVTNRSRALSLVERRGDALHLLDERVLPTSDLLLEPLGSDRFVMLREGTPRELVVHQATGAGRLVERGRVPFGAANLGHVVALPDLLLACDGTPSATLRLFSTADPDHPELAGTIPGCGSVFVADDVSSRVFIPFTGGVAVWDVSTPRAPVFVDNIVFAAEDRQLGALGAGDGAFVIEVVAQNENQFRLYDARTLALRAQVVSPLYGPAFTVADGLLYAWSAVSNPSLEVFDLRGPSPLTRVASQGPAAFTGRPRFGRRLVVSGSSDLHVHDIARAPFGFTERTGRLHGRFSALVPRPWGLHSVSDVAVKRFDLSSPDAPRVDAGAAFSQPATLVGLGAGGRAPFVPTPSTRPFADATLGSSTFGAGEFGGPWVDASNPDGPLVAGLVQHPVAGSVAGGRFLFSRVRSYDAVDLATRDLAALQPGFAAAVDALATTVVEPARTTAERDSRAEWLFSATDASGTRLGLAVNRRESPRSDVTQMEVDFLLALYDVTDPAAPRLVASARRPHDALAVATDGNVLLTLEDQVTRRGSGLPATAGSLHVHAAGPGSAQLVERGSLPLPRATRIASFDGRVAFVLTSDGVSVVDVAGPVPVVLGAIATPEPPLDARVQADRLLVTTESTFSVVSPPCPPPAGP